jgi:hypothetical protein
VTARLPTSKTEKADAAFFLAGECPFLQGVLRKTVCRTWFFDGKFVVKCVVNVVEKRRFLCAENYATFLIFIFEFAFTPWPRVGA